MKRLSVRSLVQPLLFLAAVSASASPWESYHYYLRGLLEEDAGRPDQAMAFYERALEENPQAPALLRSLMVAALGAGRSDAARAAAQRLESLSPEDAPSHVALGRVYLLLGENAKAQAAFARALKIDPANIDAVEWLTNPERSVDLPQAVERLRKFLENAPDRELESAAQNRLAKLLTQMGDAEGAEAHWRLVLESDPGNADALLGLATLYDVRGATAPAVETYEKYLEIVPEDADVAGRVGQIYFQGGNTDRAVVFLDSALRVRPRDPALAFWRALAAEVLEKWEEAIRFMTISLKGAEGPGSTLRLAAYHQRLGHHRKTLCLLRGLQRRDPENPDLMQYLAQAYEDADRPKKALRWYERLTRLDPDRPGISFRMAVQWDRLKKNDRAVSWLEKAIEQNPADAVALNYLGYSWADRGERLEEALALIDRALALEPDNPAFRDSRGWALFRLGRLEAAETDLAASARAADDPLVWSHFGDVLAALGKKDEAVRAWQEGLLLEPSNKELLRRLGAEGALDKVSPRTAARTLLKRVEGNFRQWRSAASFVDVDGRWDGRWVAGRGVWHYAHPDYFRLELLGPLMAPEVLVIHTSSGTRWAPPELLSDEADLWFSLLGEVFSGRFFQKFDDPAVAVRFDGDDLLYEGPAGTLKIARRAKTLTEAVLRPAGGGEWRLRVTAHIENEGLFIPREFRLESARGSLSFSLSGTKINTPQDPALFQWPRSAP